MEEYPVSVIGEPARSLRVGGAPTIGSARIGRAPTGRAGAPAAGTRTRIHLGLMQGFSLVSDDRPLTIPLSAQRVVAFVALRDRPTLRPHVAEMLWLDATQGRAMANLRSALWRVRQPGATIVEARGDYLSLAPEVAVDVSELVARSQSLLCGGPDVRQGLDRIIDSGDLLPEWYDDWVLTERERLRQLRLHALERACRELTAMGEYGRAVEAGLAAVVEEPLHESGHRVLIQAHLQEGNRAEALRQYDRYARLMREELRLGPSPDVQALVAHLRSESN